MYSFVFVDRDSSRRVYSEGLFDTIEEAQVEAEKAMKFINVHYDDYLLYINNSDDMLTFLPRSVYMDGKWVSFE